jgi:cell division protein FtsB
MLEKLRTIKIKPIIDALRDTRVIGAIGFGVVALLVSWSSVGVIQQNFTLQQQIAQLENEITIQQLENTNLELRNEYYNTDQYLELQARRQFGLAAPGETVLTVPERVALENSVPIEDEVREPQQTQSDKPGYQQNIEAWGDFFFRGFRGQ